MIFLQGGTALEEVIIDDLHLIQEEYPQTTDKDILKALFTVLGYYIYGLDDSEE